jgi:hypothetical protein
MELVFGDAPILVQHRELLHTATVRSAELPAIIGAPFLNNPRTVPGET